VRAAKSELESRQQAIFPELIKLLDRDEMVKLKNTADLIYPGSEEFYGHGWILDYDVDYISVRAGWLLESLTFQDFGFREHAVNESDLMNTVIEGKSDSYIADLRKKLKSSDSRKNLRLLAGEKAKNWWKENGKNWNRFDAVVNGLKSSDIRQQTNILEWLRNGETKCDGLDLKSFEKFILPEVKVLLKSNDENIRKSANYLIESNDDEKWWYRRKLRRDYPKEYSTMELAN
jgi:hypothetical protein